MKEQENYFNRPEISASDLLALDRGYELPEMEALTEGTLFDNLVLTPDQIDFFSMEVEGREFTDRQLRMCERMKRSLFADKKARFETAFDTAEKQVVMTGVIEGYAARCKYDLFWRPLGYGGDLKSTACTTQTAFEASISYFGYDLQRAWYMDISGADKDLVIAVSKKRSHPVFVVPIERGDAIYTAGREKYLRLLKLWGERYGS
jgi:hypothetical protein